MWFIISKRVLQIQERANNIFNRCQNVTVNCVCFIFVLVWTNTDFGLLSAFVTRLEDTSAMWKLNRTVCVCVRACAGSVWTWWTESRGITSRQVCTSPRWSKPRAWNSPPRRPLPSCASTTSSNSSLSLKRARLRTRMPFSQALWRGKAPPTPYLLTSHVIAVVA